MAIIPLPNTRISGLLARERLLQQMQNDQLSVFRLQEQISTGQRISVPSEDAPAALRAVALQRLLERKEQLSSNVDTGLSFLEATDRALNDVASQLGDIRGQAVGVAGTTNTDEQRRAVVESVDALLAKLVDVANTRFRGRFLFAGSQTNVKPYAIEGNQVVYSGNEKLIHNFSDIDVLFATNAPGADVFGGISEEVLGGVDLNPQTTANTRLSTINGGRGISPDGALVISDGTNTSIVDISAAATLGDVARFIEENPPPSREINVEITAQGLALQFSDGGAGNLTVTEIAGGVAARELGILETNGVGAGKRVGGDLDPVLTTTTRLDSLLGAKAQGNIISSGENNDLVIQAAANGAQFNGAVVQLVDDSLLTAATGLTAGNEAAEFDASARAARASLSFSGPGNDLIVTASAPGLAFNDVQIRVVDGGAIGDAAIATYDDSGPTMLLTIEVDNTGATTVQSVVDAIAATGDFTASHDDSVEAGLNPTALIAPTDIGLVSGNTGNSGGEANTLYVRVHAGQSTANQVAAAINAQGTFTATIDPADTSSLDASGEGEVNIDAAGVLAGGSGGSLDLTSGIQVVNGDATRTIDLSSAQTVQDLLNAFNGSDAGLHAAVNLQGNGIDVRSRLSGADYQIGENGGQTATQLGIRTFNESTKLADLNHGVGVPSKTGTDLTLVVDDGAGGTVELEIDVSVAETIGDVIQLINNHPGNNAGPVAVVAQIAPIGNGIQIVDANGRPLEIQAEFGSQAAEYLGLVPTDATSASDPSGVISGVDRHFLQTDSVFTTLTRLREALVANDVNAMERAITQIDADIERVTFARSGVGARQQALELSQRAIEDEDVQLRAALSEEIDVDLLEAISNLTARQVSLEASLRSTASIMQLSLLNFI